MSSDPSASTVSKVWNYAHVLKNAGGGYGDYVEQITYLIFLKLADEMTELGFDNPIPVEFQWSELSSKSSDEFWATTSNKQLNLLQHIFSELAIGGITFSLFPVRVPSEGPRSGTHPSTATKFSKRFLTRLRILRNTN